RSKTSSPVEPAGELKPRSERIERPLFRAFGLFRADAQQKSLGRRAVGAGAFFKLAGGTEPARRSGVLQHRTQASLLPPCSDGVKHSHSPTIAEKTLPGCCRLGGATTCLVRLSFSNESFGSAFSSSLLTG